VCPSPNMIVLLSHSKQVTSRSGVIEPKTLVYSTHRNVVVLLFDKSQVENKIYLLLIHSNQAIDFIHSLTTMAVYPLLMCKLAFSAKVCQNFMTLICLARE
jgi:hypothetical protein